ncbi:MAG: dihydroorotase family protein [Rhizobiales bacterium]|nr:dihydroorotase family protein [Hyphomicrobiales bacterium]
MPQASMLIANGDVLLPGGPLQKLDVVVTDGRISGLLAPETNRAAMEVVDASGLLVMPGVVDVHLHLGHGADISRPRVKEDAASETGAAAAGGVTTMIPYFFATEPFENGLFDEVRKITEAGARIDFGYHLVISTEEQLAAVPYYLETYGVSSFKIFMNNRYGEGARLGLPDIDDGFMYRLCETVAQAGGVVCPHPENIEIALALRKRLAEADPEGRGGLELWNASRPPLVEADAIQRAALISRAVGGQLYIVHTSSAEALDAAIRMRDGGVDISIETCPHYLTHSFSWNRGSMGKVNPPLRAPSDCEALWMAVADGRVDTVATDHVHRHRSAKEASIWQASPGFPGMQTLLPVMLSEGHHRRGIPLGRIADLLCANPAKHMGLVRKGSIEIGKDADFALVDLGAEWQVHGADGLSDAGYSIYDGWHLKGKVLRTIVRGRTVFANGTLIPEAVGAGQYVTRKSRFSASKWDVDGGPKSSTENDVQSAETSSR